MIAEYFNPTPVKVIYRNNKNKLFKRDFAKEIMNKYKNSSSKDNFYKLDKKYYVQPAWENASGFSLTIDFVKNNPEWNLSLQTHKYLKIK